MSFQKVINQVSPSSKAKGRKGMPSLDRRVYYHESQEGRDAVQMFDSKGEQLDGKDAIERLGGKDHVYTELVSDLSLKEVHCLQERHPDLSQEEVVRNQLAAQARHLEGRYFESQTIISVAAHQEPDGSWHGHLLLPDTEQGLKERQVGRKRDLKGPNGAAIEAWDKAWRDDRIIFRYPSDKARQEGQMAQDAFQKTLEELRDQKSEARRVLREGTQSVLGDAEKVLAFQRAFSETSLRIEEERHQVAVQKVDHFFQSRQMDQNLEHLVELEREGHRHTGEMRLAGNAKYGIWRAQVRHQNAVDRTPFRHMSAKERRQVRDQGWDREMEVVKAKHDFQASLLASKGPEMEALECRQAKEIEALTLRNEAAKLRDQEQELLKSCGVTRGWADKANGKAHAIGPTRQERLAEVLITHGNLLETRQEIERKALQAEAESRGRTAPEGERIARLAAQQERERENFLDLYQVRNAHGQTRLAARERILQRAKEELKERYEENVERERSPEGRELLASKHLLQIEILEARNRVDQLRDRDEDLGAHFREMALLLKDGQDLKGDLMAARHQAERDLETLRNPDGMDILEARQERERLDLADRRLLQEGTGEERVAIRERMQTRTTEALTVRHEIELQGVEDPQIRETVEARQQAEKEGLAARQQVERLRDRDQEVRDRLDDRLEGMETLAERQAARAEAQTERQAIQSERHQAEMEAMEARVRAGQDVTAEEREELRQRQEREVQIHGLDGKIAEIRDQEYDLGGHRRELALLLLQGKDLQTDLMVARHQAERDLETLRNPEGMDNLEACQERERLDLADRRLLQEAAGEERVAIRERMQARTTEALTARHETELEGVEDPQIRETVEARQKAEKEGLAARQQVERLRDRDQEVRDRLDDRLEGMETLAERQAARAEAQTERQAIQSERHQAEMEAMEARVRAGQDVTAEEREELRQRQEREVQIHGLDGKIAEIRDQEYDLGGHRRELALLLLQGKDLQTDLMVARHQAERDLETLRNPEGMDNLEARQERERLDLADRRLLREATGEERVAIRERMQARTTEALTARHETELQAVEDSQIREMVEARQQAEKEGLAARQQVESLRDRDQEVRDRLDDRLEGMETLAERQAARAEAQVERQVIQAERHQAEMEAMEARVRAGQDVTAEEREDLRQRQEREGHVLGLDALIEDLRDQEGEALGDRPGRLAKVFQVLNGTSRYDEQERLAELRRQLEREKILLLPKDEQEAAFERLEQRHRVEEEDLATRKALDSAKTPQAKAKIRQVQLDRRISRVRAEAAESLIGNEDPDVRRAALEVAQYREDSIRQAHGASLLRDQEQHMRARMPQLLPMRLRAYSKMGKAMDQRHALEIKALEARGQAKGLEGADPKAMSALKERHEKEREGLKNLRTNDLTNTATRPLKGAVRHTIAYPLKKLKEAQQKLRKDRPDRSMRNLEAAKDAAAQPLTAAATGIGKVAATAVAEAAKAAIHQAKHAAQAVAVTARASVTAVVNPLAGAKEAIHGYGEVGAAAGRTAAGDLAKGGKNTAKDAGKAGKDTAQQTISGIASAGLNAAPAEVQAIVRTAKEAAKASAKIAQNLVVAAVTLDPIRATLGTAKEGAEGGLAVGKEAFKILAAKLPAPIEKPLNLAAKIPVLGLVAKAAKLAMEMTHGVSKGAPGADLDR